MGCFIISHLVIQNVAPGQRRTIYHATAKALASLHSADVEAIGLRSYGKPNNYCKRQVGNYFLYLEGIALPTFVLYCRFCE